MIAAVARDAVVERLKRRRPQLDQETRRRALLENRLVDEAVLGDEVPSTYAVLDRWSPDVVCLGHDQHALKADLEAWLLDRGRSDVRIEVLEPYRADVYKTSKLNRDRRAEGGDYPSAETP